MHQLSLITLAKLRWCTLQVTDDDDASGLQNVSFAALQISAISPDQDFGQQHLQEHKTRKTCDTCRSLSEPHAHWSIVLSEEQILSVSIL